MIVVSTLLAYTFRKYCSVEFGVDSLLENNNSVVKTCIELIYNNVIDVRELKFRFRRLEANINCLENSTHTKSCDKKNLSMTVHPIQW